MLIQDIRYAVRSLLKNRSFTAIAVACLALGIGVNATIFSVVDGVILQPFPYKDPDGIILLESGNQRLGVGRGGISFQDFVDTRDATTTLASMAAFTARSMTVADGAGEPERYLGAPVSASLFDLLGTLPVLGRNFVPEDDVPNAAPVVILSDDVWRRRYNSDPQIVGRAILINGRSSTVIGVMPPKFAFPRNHQLWVPLSLYTATMKRTDRGLEVFTRMKPGVTPQQVQSDVTAIAARLAASFPSENESWTINVRPLREWMIPADVKLVIFTMMGAVTLVLLIACSNVANLLLARASVRHREISIRAALGAGRWRIVRQLLTEAIGIGLLSAPLGILLGWVGVRLLDRAIPAGQIPYFIHWDLDGRSVLYTVTISVLTGLVFGLAPALQAARGNLHESLKEGGRSAASGSRAWMRSTLVVVEVALSLVLLVGASMFVHSFLNLQTSSLGFDTAPLMTMRFFMPGTQYEPADAKTARVLDIVSRVETLPGVRSVFASNFVPVNGGGSEGDVIVEGKPVERGKEPSIALVAATPHLRRTLDIALVRGRDFTDSEGNTRTAVALVNQAMAKRLWGGEDPLGRRFRLNGEPAEWFTVIGVIADFQHFQPRTGDNPVFPSAYVPYAFQATPNTGLTIRVAGDPSQITASVREQIRAADAILPVFQIQPMETLRQLSFWQQRLFGIMFSTFGVIALVLASIGVYGVLSYSVSQRTQEIGVRMALGAERRDVLRLIVGHGLKLAAIGVAIGLVGAYGATWAIRSLLYNVTQTDPVSFAGVSIFLTATAFLASYLPARRATGVDPLIALRNE